MSGRATGNGTGSATGAACATGVVAAGLVDAASGATAGALAVVAAASLVAAFALTPLLLAGDAPGKEILHPVAVVIFGGLVSSTLLDTLLTPLLFWRLGREPTERLLRDSAESESTEPGSLAETRDVF